MAAVAADTHTILWYLVGSQKLSSKALAALDEALQQGEPIRVSIITLIELTYLIEKARLPARYAHMIFSAGMAGRSVRLVPIDAAVAQAVREIPRELVPDLPDRIIAATALYLDLPLVTKDSRIRAALNVKTIW